MPPAPDKQKHWEAQRKGPGPTCPMPSRRWHAESQASSRAGAHLQGHYRGPQGLLPVRTWPFVPYSPPVCWVWSLAPHGDV